jgi:hypothetical protein
MNGHYAMDNRELPKKQKREGKDPDIEEAFNQWFSIVTGRGVPVNVQILRSCKNVQLFRSMYCDWLKVAHKC